MATPSPVPVTETINSHKVESTTSAAPSTAATSSSRGPVTYQDSGIQTLPPANGPDFFKLYGRKAEHADVERMMGSGGLGRYMPNTVHPYDPIHGALFDVVLKKSAPEYVKSGFQTLEFDDRKKALTKAKIKASMTAKKFKALAAEDGFNIFAESKDDAVVHSEQHPFVVEFDKTGNATNLSNLAGHMLNNIYKEELAGEPVRTTPLVRYSDASTSADREGLSMPPPPVSARPHDTGPPLAIPSLAPSSGDDLEESDATKWYQDQDNKYEEIEEYYVPKWDASRYVVFDAPRAAQEEEHRASRAARDAEREAAQAAHHPVAHETPLHPSRAGRIKPPEITLPSPPLSDKRKATGEPGDTSARRTPKRVKSSPQDVPQPQQKDEYRNQEHHSSSRSPRQGRSLSRSSDFSEFSRSSSPPPRCRSRSRSRSRENINCKVDARHSQRRSKSPARKEQPKSKASDNLRRSRQKLRSPEPVSKPSRKLSQATTQREELEHNSATDVRDRQHDSWSSESDRGSKITYGARDLRRQSMSPAPGDDLRSRTKDIVRDSRRRSRSPARKEESKYRDRKDYRDTDRRSRSPAPSKEPKDLTRTHDTHTRRTRSQERDYNERQPSQKDEEVTQASPYTHPHEQSSLSIKGAATAAPTPTGLQPSLSIKGAATLKPAPSGLQYSNRVEEAKAAPKTSSTAAPVEAMANETKSVPRGPSQPRRPRAPKPIYQPPQRQLWR